MGVPGTGAIHGCPITSGLSATTAATDATAVAAVANAATCTDTWPPNAIACADDTNTCPYVNANADVYAHIYANAHVNAQADTISGNSIPYH